MNNTVLRMVFKASGDKRITLSYSHADSTASGANVKTAMQEICANGEIFSEPPLEPIGAEFVTRTVTPVNIA